MRPGPLEPERDRLLVGRAGVVRLLDAREQEHAVVGGEPERDREQQHGLARLQRALAREAEQPLEVAVLEDQHEQAERRAQRQQVHHQRLDRQHDRPRHQEQDDERRRREDRQRERQRVRQRLLLVEEAGGLRRRRAPAPARRPRARRAPAPWRCSPSGRPRRDEVDPVEAVARGCTLRLADDAGQLAEPLRVALDRRAVARAAARGDVDRAGRGWAGTPCSSASSTTRADWSRGSTLASTPVNLTPRNGSPSAISSAEAPTATGTGRRMTRCESRYQKPPRSPDASRCSAACQRFGLSAFTRGPSAARIAGSSVSETSAAGERADHARRRPSSRGSAAGRRAARPAPRRR